MNKEMEARHVLAGLTRIALGFIFLWAFLDKTFGLGFATEADKAWLSGGSPTYGFLSFATQGPFAEIFQAMAGNMFVDWLFMLGLLLIGLALLLGIGVRVAGYSGAVLMLLMWLSVLPPENNPVLDDHIIYALVLLTMAHSDVGSWLGLGKWWSNMDFVKKYGFLK